MGGRFFQSIQAAFQLEDGHLKICNDCKKGWGGGEPQLVGSPDRFALAQSGI